MAVVKVMFQEALAMDYDTNEHRFVGPGGQLAVAADDEISRKLAMLIAGECGTHTHQDVAGEFGFSKARYYQLRRLFEQEGAAALMSEKRGPKRNYRRNREVVCQTIRYRFLDPDASSEVIAQRLRQCGFQISKRSVDRIFADFGLQKKTLQISSEARAGTDRDTSHQEEDPAGAFGSDKY